MKPDGRAPATHPLAAPAMPVVGVVQIDVRVGDLERNAAAILESAREAARQGAELVVFPELALTGYPPRDLLLDRGFVDAAIAATAALAREAAGLPPLVVGTIARAATGPDGGLVTGGERPGHPGLFDVAAVLAGGVIQASIAKRLLPSYDVFNETRWFVPGPPSPAIALAGARAGLLVCEDLWAEGYPHDPGLELARAGATLLVCISASPFRGGILAARLRLARRSSLPFVYVNAIGANDELVFDGGSFVLGAGGRLRALLPRFAEALEVVRPEGTGGEAGALAEPEPDGPAELFSALALGVRDFSRKNGVAPAWVGVSGGIDSAVVLAIAVEALGKERVRAVALPSRFTDPRSTLAARELAARLGVTLEEVPIEPLHAAAEAVLEPLLGDAKDEVWRENAQARLRTVLLMALVNARGGLLLNTSNKTELALGYGTLYGDLAGALSALGDVTKPEVYALARWLDSTWTGTFGGLFPPFVLERPPSAELRPDQVDPFDYDRIAPIAEALVLGTPPPEGALPAEIARVRRMLLAAEHKRFQGTIVLKVTARSFGSGRMMPVTRA